MKKILLGLFFAMFAMQVNAATLSWDAVQSDSAMIIDSDNSNGEITSHLGWNASNVVISATSYDLVFNVANGPQAISSTAIEFFDTQIDIESVTMDGIANSFTFTALGGGLAQWVLSPSLILGNGLHTIELVVNSAVAGAQLSAKVSAVPLPAAVWLFGSALVGLFGASRRKSTAVAA